MKNFLPEVSYYLHEFSHFQARLSCLELTQCWLSGFLSVFHEISMKDFKQIDQNSLAKVHLVVAKYEVPRKLRVSWLSARIKL